jgi:hypothetical protein
MALPHTNHRARRALAAGLDALLFVGPFAPAYAFVLARARGDLGDVVVIEGAFGLAAGIAVTVLVLQGLAVSRRGGTIGMRVLDLAIDRDAARRGLQAAAAVHAVPAVIALVAGALAPLPYRTQWVLILGAPVIAVLPNLLGLVARGRTLSDRVGRVPVQSVRRSAARAPWLLGLGTDLALLFALGALGALMTDLGVMSLRAMTWVLPLAGLLVLEVALVRRRGRTIGMCTWAGRGY